jgi:phosphoglycolate phosphatase-like HAD superfamily hydrolase
MKKKDLIFLDLDGTLLDYKTRGYQTLLEIAGNRRDKPITFTQFVEERRAGSSNYELYKKISSKPLEKQLFELEWHSLIEELRLLNHDVLFWDTIDWIEEHVNFANLVLCTARQRKDNLLTQLRALKIHDYFEEILVSEGRFSKNELLRSYVDNPKCLFAKIYFLGDTRDDMLAGKSVGAQVLFIERGFTSSSKLFDTPIDLKFDYLPRILDLK